MKEVSKEKENPDGLEKLVNEGSAARTRPTSVEEIMRRRKAKESLENKKEETVGAAQVLEKGNDVVEKDSAYQESEKGYDRSKKGSREERGKNSSRKKEDTISSSREERLDKPVKEDHVGEGTLLSSDRVENVPGYHESKKGYDRSEKRRGEELVMDSSRKKEEAVSSSREERLDKPMKEAPVEAAQLQGNDLVEKASDRHAYEKGYDRSEKVRPEELIKDRSRKKGDATSSSRAEKLDKPMKEGPVEAAQLQGNDLLEKASDHHAYEKGYDKSAKVRREELVKERSRKNEDVASRFREGKLDKPMKEASVGAAQLHHNDLVEKVSDYHVCEKGHDRSTKVRREEHVKDVSRKKEEAISSSRREKQKKEDPAEAAQLLGNNLVEKVYDYHEPEKGYSRSGTLKHVKESSRKNREATSSVREEKLEMPKKEEPAANRKRKAEGECSAAETKLVEEHIKDIRRKKEETSSRYREERQERKMKEEDLASDRKIRVEGEFPTTEIKTVTDRDRFGVDTNMNAKRESPAAKKTDKQFHPQETGRKQARSALENLPGSRKRLRSLVVADIAQEEVRLKSDIGNKRKNQNGDHKKNKDRNMSKGHDRGKVHSDEVSDRWKKREQPKSHEHEMREKRKRSRSRDYGQNRHKRSSPLPKTEKVTSRRKKEHEELSENAVKDRLGKHHYNDNENKGESTANNKSRRYSDSKSEVGGYSPRKRREDASVKTAKWDLAPTVTASMFPDSNSSGLQAATQTEHPTVSVASLTVLKPLMEVPFRTPTARQVTSGDSVQLTESTRRMRRLYAENVPDSASEKSLIECLNGYMLSSGSNHIKGSEPCISCIINKEKSQALVEFLTPQDASAALSLDGCSFAGSYLKIRRPKDYVEATSDELEKKEPATNVLSDNVEDSSNKIFIGGFPKAISSEMIMEIVRVFGPLKAYRFVISNDLNQRCAFLEYTDGSVTLKACAGLNGMKLGGSVITAVCAYPDASSIAVNENPPFYGIPKDAKPLLGKPKHVLKLKNVVDPEDLSSLSEPEMKEILEDVRLECARFGVIKSVNIVEHQSKDITDSETNASSNSKEMNVLVVQKEDKGSKKADEPCSDTPAETNPQANEDDESIEHCEKIVEEEVGPAPAQNQAENQQEELGSALAQDQAENPQEEVGSARAVKTRWDTGDKKEEEQDPKDVFEPGCIFIEYGRPEAASDAAHSLHGRLYGDRTVKAEYVSKELYQIRFPSG